MPRLPLRVGRSFSIKLELAADLVKWAAHWVRTNGKVVRVVVDGFYSKRPFLKAAAACSVMVVNRL